jgi:YVTN family beta-propeller protein
MNRTRTSIVAVAVTLILAAGCSRETPQHVRNSGSLALSDDDALAYAVDSDNGVVAVLDTAREEKIAQVQVGQYPEAVLVGPEDRVWVANRGSGSLSHFRRGEWHEVDTVPVGGEPVSLALSPDHKTLYVVNAASLEDAEHGSLMAVDTESLKIKWDLQLPRDPRSIALLSSRRAAISLYRDGDVVEVDLTGPRVVKVGSNLSEQLNRSTTSEPEHEPFPDSSFGKPARRAKLHPRGMSQLVASPDGQRLYGSTTLATDAVLNAPSDFGGGGGSTYGGDSTGCTPGGAVATSGIVAFEPDGMDAQVDAAEECFHNEARQHPPTRLTSQDPERRVQGPSAVVTDASGTWLFVAHRESGNVAVVPASRGSGKDDLFSPPAEAMRDVVKVGFGPSGLALTRDGKTLWVHNQFDHTVQRLTSSSSGGGVMATSAPVRIGSDNPEVLSPAAVRGRALFFAADDRRMNAVGISCATCHLEGREDGHVWNFVEGPRQTPSLAGRRLAETGPFHWGGEHSDFKSFVDHTVGERMGGSGLSASQQEDLMAFIMAMPQAPNPHQRAAPTDAQLRGAQVFQKAECSTCHAQATAFQNTERYDVGTYVTTGPVPDDVNGFFRTTGGLNTPSLLGLARTAPYLHDGSAPTLKARILQGKAENRHGKTAQLTDAEVDDLVEYLKSL